VVVNIRTPIKGAVIALDIAIGTAGPNEKKVKDSISIFRDVRQGAVVPFVPPPNE